MSSSVILIKFLFLLWNTVLLLLCSHDVIVYGQTVVEGVVGGSVVLPCTLTPQGDLLWRGGGNVILIKSANGEVNIPNIIWKGDVSLVGESDLEIRSLGRGRDDNKNITCSYTGGGSTQQIKIKLLDPITGVQIPEASNGKVTVTAGTPKTLTCSVTQGEQGEPSTRIYYTWDVNGAVVSGQNSTTFSLTANKTTKNMRCTATSRYSNGTELSSQAVTVTLNVLFPITGVRIPEVGDDETMTLIAGVPRLLTCSVTGDPSIPIYYTWTVNGTVVVSGQNLNTFNLTAERNTTSVECRAFNQYENGTELSSKSVKVKLKVLVRIVGVEIREAINGTVALVSDRPKTITCSVSGNPTTPIYYVWEVNGKIVSEQNSTNFRLTANKTMKTVRCRAYNRYSNGTELSSQDGTVTLNVLCQIEGVRIHGASNKSLNVTAGTSKTLTCVISGDGCSQIHYTWKVDGNVDSGQNSSIFPLTPNKSTKNVSCGASSRYTNGTAFSSQDVTITLNVHAPSNDRRAAAPRNEIIASIAGGASGFVFLVVVIAVIIVLVRRRSNKASKQGTIKEDDTKTNDAFQGDEWKSPEADIIANDLYASGLVVSPNPENDQVQRKKPKPPSANLAKKPVLGHQIVETSDEKPKLHPRKNTVTYNKKLPKGTGSAPQSTSDSGTVNDAFSGPEWKQPDAEIIENYLYAAHPVKPQAPDRSTKPSQRRNPDKPPTSEKPVQKS